ncbi:Transposase DDE domain-containing protein [Cyclobacterium lianum]|uniref:Transposase DDE domain-containing protein n=2 Tax=Cyclobacterium lianum TaxID=388280 RepID=A0A1M7PZQ5_9BACT|nr:Transposase DDE domain-containing protein [Cyclobacterium lianum]
MADSRIDFTAEWIPSKKEQKNSKRENPIQVRITKAVLETGETELLVSNLEESKFSTEDLVTLYGMRWGVEEGIKNLKPRIKVEQFGCRKPVGIYQEFYAHILAMNMVALTGMAAGKEIKKKNAKRKLTYKYNWKNTFLHLRAKIVKLFIRECVVKILDNLIIKVALNLVAVKKGRKFPRKDTDEPTRVNQYYK